MFRETAIRWSDTPESPFPDSPGRSADYECSGPCSSFFTAASAAWNPSLEWVPSQKGLLTERTAAAKREGRLAGQIVRIAIGIDQFNRSFRCFHAIRPILADRNFHLRHPHPPKRSGRLRSAIVMEAVGLCADGGITCLPLSCHRRLEPGPDLLRQLVHRVDPVGDAWEELTTHASASSLASRMPVRSPRNWLCNSLTAERFAPRRSACLRINPACDFAHHSFRAVQAKVDVDGHRHAGMIEQRVDGAVVNLHQRFVDHQGVVLGLPAAWPARDPPSRPTATFCRALVFQSRGTFFRAGRSRNQQNHISPSLSFCPALGTRIPRSSRSALAMRAVAARISVSRRILSVCDTEWSCRCQAGGLLPACRHATARWLAVMARFSSSESGTMLWPASDPARDKLHLPDCAGAVGKSPICRVALELRAQARSRQFSSSRTLPGQS